jgi:hypothetical protein
VTKTLSLGGLLFELDHSFPPGKKLRFQFTLEEDLIDMMGQVIYCLEKAPASFDIGIKFLDVSDRDAQLLEAWFRRHGVGPAL